MTESASRLLKDLDPRALHLLAEGSGLSAEEFVARMTETDRRWLAWAKGDDLGAVSFRNEMPQRGVPPISLTVYWLRSHG